MQVDNNAPMYCAWKIESNPGHFIQFSYKYSVDKNFNCTGEFFKVGLTSDVVKYMRYLIIDHCL